MLKYDVIKRLEELQGSNLISFKMIASDKNYHVHYDSIQNYPDSEMLESVQDNFKCLYCGIESINPAD
ncbi:MAG: hypothetical protein K2H20_00280 [Bacilli bacterium]|nr:hypothetical protein [Bacilli bacterium]